MIRARMALLAALVLFATAGASADDGECKRWRAAFAAMPVRYAAERGRWSEAASLTPHPQGFPWEHSPNARR